MPNSSSTISSLVFLKEDRCFIGIDISKKKFDIHLMIIRKNIWEIHYALGSIEHTIYGLEEIHGLLQELLNKTWEVFVGYEITWNYSIVLEQFLKYYQYQYKAFNGLTTHKASQYYNKWHDGKNDQSDALVISKVLRDTIVSGQKSLEDYHTTETKHLKNLFKKIIDLRRNKWILKNKITSLEHKIWPEMDQIFSDKSHIKSKNIILKHFSRNNICNQSIKDFIDTYCSYCTNWNQKESKILKKLTLLHTLICKKNMFLPYRDIFEQDSLYIKEYLDYYEWVEKNIVEYKQKISQILDTLKNQWRHIPSIKGINDIELGVFLGDLWKGIYQCKKSQLLSFVGRYPINYQSWESFIKKSKFSPKKSAIKTFVYLWIYWLMNHQPMIKVYKKLLDLYHNNQGEKKDIKILRKTEMIMGEKILTILRALFRNKTQFDSQHFFTNHITGLIKRLEEKWIKSEVINNIIDRYIT